ncbi:predicted protein [Nematostella vectensis]|uniref:THAP-type domain-containing protein n=1 Tax=Nematostella vectensis TaxID=45351 RepID=A7SVR2_NEMVE|nr:predicted protein [Nematostella vectensis]|eukprot:XP_001624304.1 hypothetical protein NEMVEDRAFT_v1g218220 [Nematostella vectensis]
MSFFILTLLVWLLCVVRTTSFHCCVPRCTGDSRYNTELTFHRIPSRPSDEEIRKKWLVKIRRDEGSSFKISSGTRVCSRHFSEEDYLAPDNAGRRMLKRGSVPSIFDWSSQPKSRRKIVRHTDRDTQTDESESDSCEMFMFLVRLKLGLFELDLSHRFQIHLSTVSRKLNTWCNYLYFLLGTQMIWPSRGDVNTYMPQGFKDLYPTTRVILDYTEIFVQTPSSLLLQSQLYSSYKSSTTLKGLIGITPHGAVSFVSSLYSGCISDKEITRCSGILDLLEPGDSVMADKGFDIETLLRAKRVELNIPPFLEDQRQFTEADVLKTKAIASLRIHVERAIRRIKEDQGVSFF